MASAISVCYGYGSGRSAWWIRVGLPEVEVGITLSVITLGAVLVIGKPVPYLLALGFVALFGILHGHAHGTEMPAMATPWLHGAGFVLGTTALHLVGVVLGLLSQRVPKGEALRRLSGVGCYVVGVYLLVM